MRLLLFTLFNSVVYFARYRGIDILGSTVGLAFVGTMCTRMVNTGLTEDGGRSLNSVATIASHELGHIFNMGHDEDTGETLAVSESLT